jgi:ABC-type transport system involved in multi-copper enzyme maturation permease subunit
MGIGALVLLWFVGKLLGASFFLIAAVVIVFLILLIAYLVIRLHDGPLLRRIKNCIGIVSEPNQEEEK